MKRVATETGFTLLEVILVVVLMAVIAGGFGAIFFAASGAYTATDNRKEALENARWAMDRMSREIRLINNASSVTEATPSRFTFTDINANPVDFQYAAGQITRTGNLLASNVNTFSFTYLDQAGAPFSCPPPSCPAPVPIWRVRMYVETLVNGERVVLQTEVHPRKF